VCKHLIKLEKDLKDRGVIETYRGRAWSEDCKEWVYFDCQLDLVSLRRKYSFESFIVDHGNDDNKSGMELGFVCSMCKDAIMGVHPYFGRNKMIVR